MAYFSLYRRFRPTDFNNVIGQEPIVRTLINQIKMGMVGHAYLFTGSRGTGKTSTARIFARAVNCLKPKNGSPCNECAVCKELLNPTSLDLIELDAASNNGVDEIRDIRERVNFPPVNAKYKIFIIDEAHMLTASAFNALLKVLEEPPAYVIFILATTEVQKVPPTILSRCIRFDFQLVSDEKRATLLTSLFKDIGYKCTAEAVREIAKCGNGSVRDTLSIADSCIAYSPDGLTYDDVAVVLGVSPFSSLLNIANGILNGDVGAVLSETETIYDRGKGISTVYSEILEFFRTLIAVKNVPNYRGNLREQELEIMTAIASAHENHRLARIIEIISGLDADLRYSTNPRLLLEAKLIRASQTVTDVSPDGVVSRMKELEGKLASGSFVAHGTGHGGAGAGHGGAGAGNVENTVKLAPAKLYSDTQKTINHEKSTLGLKADTDAPVFTEVRAEEVDSEAMEFLHSLPEKLMEAGFGIFARCVARLTKAEFADGEFRLFINAGDESLFSNKEYMDALRGMIEAERPGYKLAVDHSLIKKSEKAEGDRRELTALFGDRLKIKK